MKQDNKPEIKTGFKRILTAFFYTLSGLRHALSQETAFKQEFCVFVILLIVLFFLNISGLLKLILFICSTGVLIVELLNSAIESVTDKVSSEYNELAKHAKDMGSAAVFLALVILAVAWIYAVIVNFL